MRPRSFASLLCVLSLSTVASCFLDPDIQRASPPIGTGAGGATTPPASGGAGGDPTVDLCSDVEQCAGFRTVDGAVPPAADPGAPPATDGPLVVAIEQVFLGDTERDGNASETAWKEFGFDLDGWDSKPTQGFHCRGIGGAKKADLRQDGAHGIDNAWGAQVVNGMLSTLISNPSRSASNLMTAGRYSWLLHLDATSTSPSASQLIGQWMLAEGTPTGQGTFLYPSSSDPDYSWHPWQGSMVASSEGYLVDHQVVLRFSQPLPLWMDFGPMTLKFTLQRATLTLDTSYQTDLPGTLAGLVPTDELVDAFQLAFSLFDTRFCGSQHAGLVDLLTSISRASDSLLDGTQDPSRDCNAISFGVGVVARPRQMGTSVPSPVVSSPCVP